MSTEYKFLNDCVEDINNKTTARCYVIAFINLFKKIFYFIILKRNYTFLQIISSQFKDLLRICRCDASILHLGMFYLLFIYNYTCDFQYLTLL